MLVPLATSETVVPAQVVVPLPATLSELGRVSIKSDCVSANAFELLSVIVSVDATVGPTVVGRNASVTVGATGVNATALVHALLPAVVGAVLEALVAPTVTVAVSVAPFESVTVNVRVPEPVTLACELVEPAVMVRPPLALHA